MIGEFSIAKFLFGFGQKALVATVKLWKQNADAAQALALEELLQKHGSGMSLWERLDQRLSVSLQTVRLSPNLLEPLRELDGDDLLRDEVASAMVAGQLSATKLAEILKRRSELLSAHSEDIDVVAATWLNAVYFAIGETPVLAHALQLQSQHRVQTCVERSELKLDALSSMLTENDRQAESRSIQLQAEIRQTLQNEFARFRKPDAEPADHSALKSRFQQRFERCRERLMHGSVRQAEEEYAELVADLLAAGAVADRDLLFRSYLNHSSCLIEESRFEEAGTALEHAKAIEPNDLRLKRHHAILLAHSGKTEQALSIVRELRVAEPNESKHLRNEAALLMELNHWEEVALLLESFPLEDAEYFCHRAQTALRQGRVDDAVSAARHACGLEPDNEAAWIALAHACGFPVIERRQRGESQALSPDLGEIHRLREAVEASDRAAELLKKRDRPRVRAEVLGNALAFHAALNEDSAALRIGQELWDSGDRSEINLRNLYFLQTRNSRPHEALVTAEAMVAAGLDDGRLRRAQALAALGSSEPVLLEWNTISEAAGSDGPDDEWVLVASRAWCAAHQRERALGLLEQMIERRPDSSDLHLERAAVLEELGRMEAAAAALVRAETIAPTCAQVAVDFGLFLFRQERWAESLERLERVGASSVASPLHRRFLICLHNSWQIRRCAQLISTWHDESMGYDETVYALGARCAIHCEDLPLARQFLDELVRRGSDRDGEHRKMLGQIYLRLDEQEQAYNVLAKVVADRPADAEAFVLLGQVCTARGRHQEALEHTRKAVELAPENMAVRASFFGAMTALPEAFTPTADCIAAHQENTAALTEDPSGILRAVQVTPDLGGIREILEENEKRVLRVFEAVDSKPLPFGFLATQTGTPLHEAWAASMRDPKRGVLMCPGSGSAQNEQLAVAKKGGPISVDLLALFTLQRLGLLRLLARQYKPIFAHISLLDTIVEQLTRMRDHPRSGRMGSHSGQLFFEEADPAEEARTIAFLTEIRDFLKSPPVQLVGLEPGAITDERFVQIATACGRACILPIFVARERAAALLSDDLVVRGIGKLSAEAEGFCSQWLLRAARDGGALPNHEYQDAILHLVEWNYHFVADESRTLIRLFDRVGNAADPIPQLLINRIGNPKCNTESAMRVLVEAFAHIWVSHPKDNAQEHRQSWIKSIWQAVLANRKVVPQFLHFLALCFATRPAQFVGAVVWGLREVPELGKLRVPVLRWSLQITRSLAESDGELPISWPVGVGEWFAQFRALRLLIGLRAV